MQAKIFITNYITFSDIRQGENMKYTINGYSQEKLLKNNLDLSDSIILRVLADIYSSNGKKIEYKIINNDKYMWISYGYLFEQIPIIGSERTLVRKIDSLIEKGMLKKELVTSKKGIKGRFLYISFGEKYFELTEYSNNTKEEIKAKETENTKCQIDTDQMTKCHEPNDKLTSHQMTKCHNKDSSINDPSIKDSSYKEKINKKEKNKKENFDHTKKLLDYIETLEIDSEKKEIFKEWVEYKKSKCQYKDTKSLDILVKRFIKYSVQELRDIIEKSIMNNYSGIFEPKEGVNNGNNYNARYGRKQENKHSKKPDYTKGFDDWN